MQQEKGTKILRPMLFGLFLFIAFAEKIILTYATSQGASKKHIAFLLLALRCSQYLALEDRSFPTQMAHSLQLAFLDAVS